MTTTQKLNKVEQLKQDKDGLDVLQDLYRYSREGNYSAIEVGDLEQRFKWFGVYRQKPNTGHFMLRIKIPGGQLSPAQLRGISEICNRYARGFGDITTRQTIQLHWLTIDTIEPIFKKLGELGMNSQFSCGDVPRNVVGCPLAGVAQHEIVDSSQLIQDVAKMYQDGGKAFSNLPRKYKTALGGCHLHCHQPQINDLGFFGVKRDDGQVGYGLLVGGGLSSTPHFAQPMRAFVKPQQVLDVAQAVAILFRDYGYRQKRTRARLKFLVADQGWQWTRDKIEEILGYQLEHDDTLLHPPAVHSDHMGVGQQKDGLYYVGVPIERGRWTARNMADVARLAQQYAQPPPGSIPRSIPGSTPESAPASASGGTSSGSEARIRLTAKQNLLILDVPKENVADLCADLEVAGLPTAAHWLRSSLISCTGSEFCNLAVVETKHRAGRVLQWLEANTQLDQPVVISFTGCPNACAQYQICDIGLTGFTARDAQRLDDKGQPMKVDGYNVLLGAGIGSDPKFGEVIAKKVVGDRIHLGLKNLLDHYMADRIDEDEPFRSWVARNEPEYLQNLIVEPVDAPDAVSLPA